MKKVIHIQLILLFLFILAKNQLLGQTILETSPSITADGLLMVCLIENNGQFLLCSKQRNLNTTGWSNPKPIESLNSWATGAVIITPTISFDGRELYFSSNKTTGGDYNIFVSHNENGFFQTPQELPAPINTSGWEEAPSLSGNKRILYFVRRIPADNQKRKNKESTTIYRSFLNDFDQWQKPEAIIAPINMDGEVTPRIMPDNVTLFFSSKRTSEIKKEDVNTLYYTKNIFGKDWLLPVEIPFADHTFEVTSPTLDYINKDLVATTSIMLKKKWLHFMVTKPLSQDFQPEAVITLQGTISNLIDKTVIEQANVTIIDAITSQLFTKVATDKQGYYTVFLPRGKKYKLDFSGNNYSHHYSEIEATTLKKDTLINYSVALFQSVSLLFNVFDHELFDPLNATIQIFNAISKEEISLPVQNVGKGRYTIALPIGKNYDIHFIVPNFRTFVYSMNTLKSVQFNSSEVDIELIPGKSKTLLTLKDIEKDSVISGNIRLVNLDHKEIIYISDTTKHQKTLLRQGDKYQVLISATGYFLGDTTVTVGSTEASLFTILLHPIVKEVRIELRNITFELGAASLKEESSEELDKVVELLKNNPTISIELSAHTDNVGSDNYNDRLSMARAKSTASYIMEKGISKDRIVAVGYGKKQPLVSNDTEGNKAINRRVEFKVIGGTKK